MKQTTAQSAIERLPRSLCPASANVDCGHQRSREITLVYRLPMSEALCLSNGNDRATISAGLFRFANVLLTTRQKGARVCVIAAGGARSGPSGWTLNKLARTKVYARNLDPSEPPAP